jgi:hypothetical protein
MAESIFHQEYTTHHIKCCLCNKELTALTHDVLLVKMNEHEALHTRQKATGKRIKRIKGKVFDTSKVRGITYVGEATKAANDAGFTYLTWNGYVYYTNVVDFENPLCRVEDVDLAW